MNIIKNKSNILKKVKDSYLYIFIIYFITMLIDTTTVVIDYPICSTVSKIVRYGTYFCFLIRLFLVFPDMMKNIKKIKLNKAKVFLLIMIMLLLLSIVGNVVCTGEKRLILLLLVLLSSYNIHYDSIIKRTMQMQIILMTIIVSLSILGVTQNYIVARAEKSRYCLGFVYTTNLSQLIMFSILLVLYIKKFRIDNIQILYFQLINLFTYFITDSRAEFIFLEFIIITCLLYNIGVINKIKRIKKYISGFFSYSFWIYPIFSFIIVYMYPLGGVFFRINKILSNRLAQTYSVLKEYGLKLFGSSIEFVGLGIVDKLKYGSNIVSNYVDNEYIQLLLTHGILFIVSFILVLNFMLIQLYKKHEYQKIFICIIYLMFGILNPRIINLLYSPIPFIIMYEITNCFNEHTKEIQDEKLYS